MKVRRNLVCDLPPIALVLVTAAIGLFVLGYYWGNQHQRGTTGPPAIGGVLVQPPRDLPDFELRDAGDLPFTAADFRDRWTLLAFGALDAARGHLAVTKMIGVHNHLGDKPELSGRVWLALVAERQAPELALDFSRLARTLKVLSGESGEVGRLTAALGGKPSNGLQGEDPGTTLFLVDPKGRLSALFPDAQEPGAIAADLSALSAHADSLPTEADD